MRLSTLSRIGGLLLAFGFVALVAINWSAIRELKVRGPLYERIVLGKDLVADALPPPIYVIEAYLEASLLLHDQTRTAKAKERVALLRKDYLDRQAFWKSHILSGEITTALQGPVDTAATKFWDRFTQGLIPAIETGDKRAAAQAFAELAGLFEAHRSGVEALVAAANAFNTAIERDAAATEARYTAIMAAAAIGGIVIVIAFLASIQLLVLKPITGLGRIMGLLARGELQHDVPGVNRKNEVGLMAQAVVTFRDSGRQKVAMEAEARRVQDALDQERAQAEAQKAEAASKQSRMIGQLGHGLSRLAARDLNVLLADFPAEYRQIETDFNAAIVALRETMEIVAANSKAILSGSGEISTAADDLSRRTEQQAASLEETAAALDEITASGRKAAEGADHARIVVSTAKEDAEKAGHVVARTVQAMGDIEKSASKISQIISVIDEIAFQTNLLALNAGVEAARAGDAGRGFAVVASEVRALAQRSADAAKEIKALISMSSGQVAEGVALVAETGQSLQRILAQVHDITKAVVDIAAGAQEQATGLGEVNTAINEMDEMTQKNAAMVEQSTAASHALRNEASQLVQMIGEFTMGQRQDVAAPDRQVAAQRAARPVPQAKVARGGQAVQKSQPDTGWQDF